MSTSHAAVTIRPARVADAGAILKLVNELAIQQILLPRSPASVIENIRDFQIAEVHGEFAGVVSLHHIDRKGGIAQLQYWVSVPHWGRGIATAAARLAVRYARDELGLRRLRSRCLEGNAASRRVLGKLGFEIRGSFAEPAQARTRFRGALVLRYRCRISGG